MKYRVEVRETVYGYVDVEAEYESAAREKAYELMNDGNVTLTGDCDVETVGVREL